MSVIATRRPYIDREKDGLSKSNANGYDSCRFAMGWNRKTYGGLPYAADVAVSGRLGHARPREYCRCKREKDWRNEVHRIDVYALK